MKQTFRKGNIFVSQELVDAETREIVTKAFIEDNRNKFKLITQRSYFCKSQIRESVKEIENEIKDIVKEVERWICHAKRKNT